ncbi:putative mitochondrial carrier protein [Trypanosoma grayi]|uniref:putative mitochondrial carrier protein n=1 Tax=Trypanosoma grayi TaxID=71804 RepID=UPI0004F4B283|nr:putative mitochondrial carrier protein [Trypanosoma grayi]KEG12998.1 putative mitochondrial carrier protein [Trypanosoma grayi]
MTVRVVDAAKPEQHHQQQQKRASVITHTVATQAAGGVSTIVLYPIDVVKMRFMSQDGTVQRQHNRQTYRSISEAFAAIYREEGLRALFRGCHVAVLGAVVAWGVYMYLYRSLCAASEALVSRDGQGRMEDFVRCSLLSAVASCSSALVCNPIWLIKTRMQLEELATGSSHGSTGNYSSFIRGTVFAVRSTGFCSLWRGVSAQVLLGLPNALNFPLYEVFKFYRLQRTCRDSLSTQDVCVCSTVAKACVTVAAHPINVLKTRLQDHRSRCGELQYVSLVQSVVLIWKRHGVRGIYRGIIPAFLQSVPRSVLTFVLYERFMHL